MLFRSIDALLARSWLKTGKPEKALEAVAAYVEDLSAGAQADLSQFRHEHLDCCFAAAGALLETGEAYRAVKVYNHVAQHADGRARILAAEGCAQALVKLRRYSQAVEYFTYAIRYAKSAASKSAPDEYDDLLPRLRKQKTAAEDLRDAELYGEDFAEYKKAERLRRVERDFAKALPVYRAVVKNFPGTVYAEASAVYGAERLVELGKFVEAQSALEHFYRADRWGLYRGEALSLLADLALNQWLNLDAAGMWCSAALDWIAEVRKREKELDLLSVPDAAKTEKVTDWWGNAVPSEVEPGMLVNRMTADWYLSKIEREVHLKLGFVEFMHGRRDEAKKHFEKMRELDEYTAEKERHGSGNAYRRLVMGADNGYFRIFSKCSFASPLRPCMNSTNPSFK